MKTLRPWSARTTGTVLAVPVVAALGVLGVTRVASASTPSPAPSPSSSPAAKAHHPLRGLEHGSLTMRAKGGTRVVDLQRGTVTAVSPTSLTVRSADGFTGTYAVDSATRVRRAGVSAALTDVHVGDRVATRATAGRALQVRDAGAVGTAGTVRRGTARPAG